MSKYGNLVHLCALSQYRQRVLAANKKARNVSGYFKVKPPSLPFSYFFHRLSHDTLASLVVDSVRPSLDNNFEPCLLVSIVAYQRELTDLSTGTVITNYSFLSPHKRQRALRAIPSPSQCANRLPALPEHSVEQDSPSCSSSISSSSCSSRLSPPSRPCRSDASSSCSSSTSSSRLSLSEKRRSRYGRDEFALDPNFLRATAPEASSPAPNKQKQEQKHQTVRLSAFDIVIDITSPTSPVSDVPPLSTSTMTTTSARPGRTREQRPKTAPRARTRSPTPSLTSMSACSSNDMPTTPLTSDDDEWPGLNLSPSPPQLRKTSVAQRVRMHPFAISTSSMPPNVSSATALEFALADPEGERANDDEMSWYARELGQVVSLASPCMPSGSGTRSREELLFPLPPSHVSCKGPRSRMSKPLPAIPHMSGPNPQLDPTFPRRRPPVPGASTTMTPSVRKSLKITVPRAPPRTSLPHDVADVFDDSDAWSVFVPSSGLRSTTLASTTSIGAELSPPRIPETPMSVYSAYDPVELISDYATQPSPLLTSFLPEYDSDDEEEDDEDVSWPMEEKLSSRWSCSTITTLAAGTNANMPTSPSASEKLRFHLGSVARRVRRVGGDAAVPKTHSRSSSEPTATPEADGDGEGVRSESGHEEADTESCLRRKPIPLELFLRQ